MIWVPFKWKRSSRTRRRCSILPPFSLQSARHLCPAESRKSLRGERVLACMHFAIYYNIAQVYATRMRHGMRWAWQADSKVGICKHIHVPKTFFCGAWQAVLIVDNRSVKGVWLVRTVLGRMQKIRVLASLGDTNESLCLRITKTHSLKGGDKVLPVHSWSRMQAAVL